MKKLLAILLTAILVTSFSACGEKASEDMEYSSETNDSSTTVKGYDGKVAFKWDDVEEDYKKLETEAEDELKDKKDFSREEIEEITKKVEDELKNLEKGITSETRKNADTLYKNAHKLEIIAKRDKDADDNKFLALAKDAKAMVKQYHGQADEDFDTVSERIGKTFDDIKDYTDEKWNSFLDALKMD